MKLFKKMTDGGPESNSVGYWLIEAKSFLSILLLRFKGKSREVYHEHAFHCIGWVLKGELLETLIDGRRYSYKPSFKPFFVGRRDYHQVDSVAPETWVFSIRGPWKKKWRERSVDGTDEYYLTNGRRKIKITGEPSSA